MADTPITLTPTALEQARTLRDTVEEYQGKPIRVYLDGKGCDGFYYGVCFDTQRDTDTTFALDDLNVVIDQDTLQFVEGSVIDWVNDERGKGFLVDNPNHKKFRGKFFKRKQWQERLLD